MKGITTVICITFISTLVSGTALYSHEALVITSDPEHRLPDTLTPTYYDLSLTIYPDSSEYSGYVFIHFDVVDNYTTQNIYLHADPDFIVITEILLNNVRYCEGVSISEDNILEINCYNMDITGKDNILFLDFTSKFSTEAGLGLVKTSYLDQGVRQTVIESDFKPTFARRAFPCFDEPNLKASFSLGVTYPDEYTIISNTPVKAENSGGGIKATLFEDTPKISTYLLTIFISKLQEASSSSGDEYEFKVFTRPGVVNMTSVVAGAYSDQITEQLGDYIGAPYKDLSVIASYHLAVPNYYADTMGDFGLFTYRESELLDEGDKTSARVKQNIISAMAYKLSHAWFGGSVSTRWWSDVWANEAVATYFKYIIPDQIDEELELTNQFTVEVVQKALQYDALPSAQPLSSEESDVTDLKDIQNKLDSVSFLKGASILHMTKYVVRGADNLKSALQYHWTQRQDSDTDGEDTLLDLVQSQDMAYYYPLLETWAFSSGFPLLSAKLIDSDDDRVDVTQLSQKRFVYPMENMPDYSNDTWSIPLTATSQGVHDFNGNMDGFYEPDQDVMYFGGSNIWLFFNLQGGAFYRVNYEEQLWRRFIGTLKSGKRTTIDALSRAKLVDDIFNIARTGDVSYALAFELADYLKDETEYYPWYSALDAFSYFLGKLEDDEVEAKLKKYVLDLMDEELYIPSDIPSVDDDVSHVGMLKRVMILDQACQLGHLGCVAYAGKKFDNFKENQNSLEDYNFRGIVFCYGIRHSDNVQEDWLFLWSVFTSSRSVHERNDILRALGCAEDKLLLISLLQRTITANSMVNKQDALQVFKSVLSSSLGVDAAMEFLQNNAEDIASFYNGVDILTELLYALAEKLFTDEQLDWVKEVVSGSVLDDYDDVRSKAIVLVSVNNYWRNHFQGDVRNLFSSAAAATTNVDAATTTEGRTGTGVTTPLKPLLVRVRK